MLLSQITCAWLLTCPWTLYYSTHVYNPSYLLPLSCLFFVGFFELMPSLTGNLVSPGTSLFLLGFSLTAASQFHLSWPLLLPFLLIAVLGLPPIVRNPGILAAVKQGSWIAHWGPAHQLLRFPVARSMCASVLVRA